MRWKAGVALGLALAAGVLLVGAGGSTRSAVETRPWQKLPDPPLSPREFPTGFWTGEEVVLVGGSDAPPCPPNAGCVVPTKPPLADGAAYDPKAGVWRSIADAPVAFEWAYPVVIGSTAYLWVPGSHPRPESPSAFLAYRIDDDRWEEVPLPTRAPNSYYLLAAGHRVIAYAYGDEEGELPDFVYDPRTEDWSELPDDPFSAGFDRVMYWSGEELLLFDHEIVPHPDEHLPLRGAALDLDGGVWRVLDDPEAAHAGMAPTPRDPDDFVHAGTVSATGANYRLRSGIVLDEETSSRLLIPELEPLEFSYGGTTDVTAGTDLFVFLGSSWDEDPLDPDGQLHSAAWLWSPRPE